MASRRLGHRGHVGLRPHQQPQVVAGDLVRRVARQLQEGRVRVGDRVLGRACVEDRDAGGRGLERAPHQAHPLLGLPSRQERPRAVAEQAGLRGFDSVSSAPDASATSTARSEMRPMMMMGGWSISAIARIRAQTVMPSMTARKASSTIRSTCSRRARASASSAVRGVADLDGAHVQDAAQQIAGRRVAGGDEDRRPLRRRLAGLRLVAHGLILCVLLAAVKGAFGARFAAAAGVAPACPPFDTPRTGP